MNSRKRHIKIKLLITFLVLLLLSCENRLWDNPFDPDCPKEIFTPSQFTSRQEGNQVKLSWTQSNLNITGFVIERSVNGDTWSQVATISKTVLEWNDTNIIGGEQYTYRIVANAGNNLSSERTTLITPTSIASVQTNQISIYTTNAANLGGNIISNGGLPIIEKGICYNNSPNPTINNHKISIGAGAGIFNTSVTNLNPNTKYYVRAYAINTMGIAYGNQVVYTTDNSLTDVEGNEYKTVIIGNQVWMAENLKTTKYTDGTTVPFISNQSSWPQETPAYGWQNNDIKFKTPNGALYNWFAVSSTTNGNKNICPSGWHVPTINEYYELINFLGGQDIAGIKLKETGTIHWKAPNSGADNVSGFTAISLGGSDVYNFTSSWHDSRIWTSSSSGGNGWYLYLHSDHSYGRIYGNVKRLGLSVRCIKD